MMPSDHPSHSPTKRPLAASKDLIDYLKSDAAFGAPVSSVVETHMSYVFLTSDSAYKLKKSIQFPFADFRTVDARHRACEREIEINQMYPSGLYLGVIPITKPGDGYTVGGTGPPVDWLVEMKLFDRANELDKLAMRDGLNGRCIDQLAELVADQHRNARPVLRSGIGQPCCATVENVATALQDLALGSSLIELVETWTRRVSRAVRAAGPELDLRRRHGFVKRCHGDLHLGNICLLDGRAMPFDAIEFSEKLATIDVLYDAAFPVMDLIHHGKRDLANRFLNRYLSATQDYCGMDLMSLFLSLRAAVRAMTALMALSRSAQDRRSDAAAYMVLANRLLEGHAKPSLIAIGGLSGTGKSSLARELATTIVPAAGAIILRSDVIRKRLAGVSPEEDLPSSEYSRGHSKDVYARLFKLARQALSAGQTVILDAAFLDTEERDAAAALAAKKNVRFHGVWLEVQDVSLLQSRVSRRVNDASDATEEVVAAQSKKDLGRIDWHRIDASPTLGRVASLCCDLIRTVSPARWPESVEFGSFLHIDIDGISRGLR